MRVRNELIVMEPTSSLEQEHTQPSAHHDSFPTPRKKRSDNTKRFSDEQVKSLESMFHRGPKLEPRNKLQLAKDLGLQPRQVSIWFQNKRARWKSKQMEQEYAALKANFDALYQQYESLKKENESLTAQFGRLNSVLETPQKEHSSSGDLNENGTDAASAGREQISEHGESHERARSSNVNRVGMNEYFGEQEEPECNTSSDQEDSWQVLSRKEWCSFVPSGNLDDPCCPSSWWDFWM